MSGKENSSEQLMEELFRLRKKIAELETSEKEMKKDIGRLAESEEKYRNIVEMSPNGIVTIDLKGRITTCNKAFFDETGYSREDIIGKKFTELPHLLKGDIQRYLKIFGSLLKGKIPKPLRFGWVQKDGAERTSEAHISLIKKKGRITGILAIARDISEQMKAEHVVSENEKKFRSLVENANDAIYIITHEGFQYVNPAFEDLTGYTSNEVCEKTFDFWNIIHPDDVEIIRQRELARREGKEVPSRYEFRIMSKDGQTKIVEPATVSIGEKGEAKVIGILRDVTERKQAEGRIRASLQEKNVLLREIHHRVKNNMQIISSLLRLQSRSIKDGKMVEMFKESQNRIRSMALIHEKLYQTEDLSRINFAEYIRSLTVHLFHTYRVNPNIVKINTDVEDVYLSINKAIPCGLILNELVSNALKHAFPKSKKGEIQIRLYSNSQNRMKLIIGDDGIGLPENLNIQNPETLGLQLVNDLVKQIEGSVTLDRTEGTTFSISF